MPKAYNPFRITSPAIISFSGGRTSAYMLHRIRLAHDGVLPDGVRVVFANTGRERDETLDFVRDCGSYWGVPIIWLEYQDRRPAAPLLHPTRKAGGFRTIGCHGFSVVEYATASRRGDGPHDSRPFREFLRVVADYRREAKGLGPMLPSRAAGRGCTAELKIRTMRRWLEAIGVDTGELVDVIGIRADEPKRVQKFRQQTAGEWEIGEPLLPLAEAGVTEADVMAFWAAQPFDLAIKQEAGNCDLCMMKAKSKLLRLMRADPASADWWIAQERATGQTWCNYFGPGGYADGRRLALEMAPADIPADGPDEIACHCTD